MKRRLRVLSILRSPVEGGVERTALTLQRGLRHSDRLFLLALLERYGDLADEARLLKGVLWPRSRLRTSPDREDLLFALRSGGRVAYYAIQVRSLLSRIHPAVLITHSSLDVLLATRLAHPRRVPWVACVGNDVLDDLDLKHPGSRFLMRPVLARIYRLPDHLVTSSQGLRQSLIRTMGVAPERVHVLPNPVDLDRLLEASRAPLEPAVQGRFILGVGRLVEAKGFDLLLRAVSSLGDAHADTRVVLLGDGCERPRLLALARSLGLEGRLDMPGHEPNPWRYMARASVVVVPSRSEGFSNVTAEALACGAPVVVTDCRHGPRELVTDGVNGRVVSLGNVEALAQGIRHLLDEDPERLEAMRQAARERSLSYDVPPVCAAWQSLISGLLEARTP